MEVSERLVRDCSRRLILSRMRLLCNNGFYGLLLMHAKMVISDDHETAWVEDGDKIAFNPEFLRALSDSELDYVMMHQILHIILEHLARGNEVGRDISAYDEASDIVVNSNILRSCGGNPDSISIEAYGGEQAHKAPDGSEGWEHTVGEIYEMLLTEKTEQEDDSDDGHEQSGWDYHQYGQRNESGEFEEDSGCRSKDRLKQEFWKACVLQTMEAMANRQSLDGSISCGNIPLFAERFLEEIRNPQTDWRTILNEFVQEEVNDYSFTPPDRRFDDSPFFLPDFNEKDEKIENILFMIDTSGSMDSYAVSTAYSEVKGAIDQFGGVLKGWLSFFDAEVKDPQPFCDEEEFSRIIPKGGGGTNFRVIFEYVRNKMYNDPPECIVILTDGYADYPDEKEAGGIPVLWLFTTAKKPPIWGKHARIRV